MPRTQRSLLRSVSLRIRLLLRRIAQPFARIDDSLRAFCRRRDIALGKLPGVTLRICIAVAVLGFFGAQEAHAQHTMQGTFYGPGGSIAIGKFKVPQTYTCGHDPGFGGVGKSTFDLCVQQAEFEKLVSLVPEPDPEFVRPAIRPDQQPTNPATLSLTSSVPALPFLGNRLVVLSFVANATGFTNGVTNATEAYAVDLRRQADCSLVEDFTLAGTTPSALGIVSLPTAQNYFHQLSGLTTTPNVFSNGCNYPTLGQSTTTNALLLGTTPAGGIISAELTNSGSLLVSVTDLTANTFTTTTLSTTVNGAYSAADLNGDGFMDLVATFVTDPVTGKSSTAVFLGNGDGTFKPGVYYDVPGDITIDDVTGDGKPDIVVLTNPGVTTLIGKGDGTFTVGPVSATSRTTFGQAAAQVITGNFNGKTDLLTGGTVLLGAGDGTFTVGSPISSDPTLNFDSSVPTVAVGDLNNDGKLDVVVSQPGFVAIFYGNGDGTFKVGPRYAALADYEQVAITDIDGDGNADIVVGASTGGIYTDGGYDILPPLFQILMGRGDGTFVDSADYNQGSYGGPQEGALEIASADFNGDKKPDVLVFGPTIGGNSLAMLPGDGTGNLGAAVTSPINIAPTMIVAADMNHDGVADAVLAGTLNGQPYLSVLFNQGNGTFAGEKDYMLPNYPVSVAVGDFNGDGLMDVAVGVAPSNGNGGPSGVYVLLGQANGTLAAPVQIDSSLNPTGLVAGSLTSDGRTDLVVADQGFFNFVGGSRQVNGAVHVYLGNANGSFTTAAMPSTSATNYSVAALGDLNHDGKLDLILAGNVAGTSIGTGTPNVYTLLGNGDGTFQSAITLPLSGTDGIGATSIAIADFNHDGKMDVVAGNPNDYTEVLLGNGDGTLVNTLLALGQRPGTVAAADLTGSGFPELLVGQGTNLAVLLNGNTWLSPVTTVATTTAVTSSANPATVGQSVTLTATVTPASGSNPTGTVTFLDGTTSLCAGTVSAGVATCTTSALIAGSHSITAVYPGDTNFSASTSAAITITVNPVAVIATTTTLTASATSAVSGTSLTFTATVSPASGTTTPAGTVTFADGTTTLGTVTLVAGGAAYTNSALAVGSHTITAAYSGATTFSASTSASLPVTIMAPVTPGFTLALSATSSTVTHGSPASTTVTVASVGGFSAAISLTCTGAPANSLCTVSPASITPGANPATVTVTLQTIVATASLANFRQAFSLAALPVGFIACLALFGLPRKRRWPIHLLAFTIVACLFAATGCGGKGNTAASTATAAPGTYILTITGTSGTTINSTPWTVIIQ
jgi:hypothetical protein